MATQDDLNRNTSTEVPPVTDNIPSTPRFIKYGAAVLLGLAVGVATYVGVNGFPSSRTSQDSATEQSTTATGKSASTSTDSIFEPMLAPAETTTGQVLQEAANAESVAPLTPIADDSTK